MKGLRLFVAVAIDEVARATTLIEPLLVRIANRIHP